MNPTQEMEKFVRDGYARYADAKDAVTAFERHVQEALMACLESKNDWTSIVPRRGERGRGKAVTAGLWPDSGQPAVWASNADEGGGSVELGVRWGRHPSGRPYLYTTRWQTRFRKMVLSDPKPPVESFSGHLIVLVENDFDLETTAELLLAETDRALALLKSAEV